MKEIMEKSLYCCGCANQSQSKLVSGKEVYPHRLDLADLPFWQCLTCKNFVGCHHKTKNPTKPLGVIPTPEIKKARQHIHAILDPLWQPKDFNKRGVIYKIIAQELGKKEYHTANIKSIEEAREVYKIVKNLPALMEEREVKYKAIEDAYLEVRPKEGVEYLVEYGNEWKEGVFIKRSEHRCSLHGELYYDYWFRDNNDHDFSISIYGEISLEKRTKEIKKVIKSL